VQAYPTKERQVELHLAAQVQPNTSVFPEGVIVDAKGHLFGTTLSGGKYDFGVAFEITP
jgi:uncharacterized repeat protein (TIGR03803 family)